MFGSKNLAPPLKVLDYNPVSAPRLTSTVSKYSLLHFHFWHIHLQLGCDAV